MLVVVIVGGGSFVVVVIILVCCLLLYLFLCDCDCLLLILFLWMRHWRQWCCCLWFHLCLSDHLPSFPLPIRSQRSMGEEHYLLLLFTFCVLLFMPMALYCLMYLVITVCVCGSCNNNEFISVNERGDKSLYPPHPLFFLQPLLPTHALPHILSHISPHSLNLSTPTRSRSATDGDSGG